MTSHIEDKLFKSMITLFTSKFFEFFMIKEFIKRSAPTEIVEIEPQRYYPDYVGETIEGNYVIVEFQSTPISKKDMRRFLTYTVLLHNKTKKDIGTYIICSPKIRNIKQIYKINEELLYKPQIISLKKINGDEKLYKIKNKIQNNEKITKKDTLELILIPLMKTNNTIEKQIQETYKITNQIKKISIEDKNTIKCTQILLIDKFVKNKKRKLKMIEEIGMNTNIIKEYGQEQMKKGMEKGMEKGREEEREKNMIETAKKLIAKKFPIEDIIDITGLTKKEIQRLK